MLNPEDSFINITNIQAWGKVTEYKYELQESSIANISEISFSFEALILSFKPWNNYLFVVIFLFTFVAQS